MGAISGLVSDLGQIAEGEPLLAVSLGAALFAFATTPIAFAVLGRMQWFRARRGRTMQRPEFWSVVASMMLVMGIPAIFALMALKSRQYDESRYEFDPNLTISVLDQGRQYRTLREADEGVRAERKRLEAARQALVDSIKELDEAMLPLRAAAVQHPATYQAIPRVLDTLAVVHKQIGLDAPQQLLSEIAPPAELPPVPVYAAYPGGVPGPTAVNVGSIGPGASLPPPAEAAGNGLSTSERQMELASVPEAQRPLAALLPLSDVPEGWALGEMGGKHLETFDAENLYEKIDGRAESFIQYDVTGMAYTYYHPEDDEASEAQLYVFQMANPLKSFGKYSSEKPGDFEPVDLGDEGYTSAGSVFFYAGPYYTQVVTTTDTPEVSAFALEIARKVAERQKPGAAESVSLAAAVAPSGDHREVMPAEPAPSPSPAPAVTEPPDAGATPAMVTPAQLFAMLPSGPNRSGETYATQDVFGYEFLTDVFLADYAPDGDLYWQGFLRPYPSPEKAAEMFDEYIAAIEEYGGEVEEVEAGEAEKMVVGTLYGLYDAVFLKGNTLAGVNGSTERDAAETFARDFAGTLPARVPTIDAGGDDTPIAAEGAGSDP